MSEPLRSCCVCRFKGTKANFVHIVKSPDGIAAIDIHNKLQGRGTYLCFDPLCLETAEKSGNISRALKNAQIPENFWLDLRKIIEARGINPEFNRAKILVLIALARRAKNLIIGTDNIKQDSGKKLLVMFANNSSESVKSFAQNFRDNFQLDATIEELSNSIGIASSVQIVAIENNSGFARKIKSLLHK